ncbi:hypothetical protein TKK_0000010 [Trichogramma kaykai]|uniref:Anaphase-promoting complex subunit 1 n=1 Tax=Trichogramma kaykai TaxID=54128 RepID=A0ABD2VTU0_9HYME
MINASDPVEYLPNGHSVVKNHPESKKNESYKYHDLFQSIISEKLKNLDVGSKSSKEFWILRDNDDHLEEELYCSGKLAVLSKGGSVENTKQISYCCETDIVHALWCSFHNEDKNRVIRGKPKNPEAWKKEKIDCICLFDAYTLKVFTETGENHISSLQFKVSAVWATKYGLILEKSSQPSYTYGSTIDNIKNISTTEDAIAPTVYSLTHPLDDFCPVLIKQGTTSLTWDPSLKILFTNEEPSFAFVYDSKTTLHSIYKIRQATSEECQLINASADNTSLVFNSVFSPSLHHASSSAMGIKGSTSRTFFSTLGTSGSPFQSRANSYATSCSANISMSSQHLSKSQSPMATISRCQSPTNPIFSTMSGTPVFSNLSKSHQTLLAYSMGKSDRNNVFSTSRTINAFSQFSQCSVAGMIVPELCLEHVWTENINQLKDTNIEHASRVFLTTDLIGQVYFCYVLTNQYRLCLVRLEKSHDPGRIILGMVTTITAKDAINLPKLNMMAVMELNGNITIYSGSSYVGKLHIPSVLPSIVGPSFALPHFYDREIMSPYPKRSSLILTAATSSPDIKFDDGVHLLSPVGEGRGARDHLIDNSLIDGPTYLKSAVGNKLVLEYGYSSYYKVTLPTLKASPLVSMCLKTLRNILPRDLATQLLVKWYVARNAPGPQDLTVNQEWKLFLIIFFTLFGYDINKLPITTSDGDLTTEHCSPVIVSKKQKTTNNGSTDDWNYLMGAEVTGQVQNYLTDSLGLTKWQRKNDNCDFVSVRDHKDEAQRTKINLQSPFVVHLPQVLFALHLLYEELKLNSAMSESLPLLAKLLHQLCTDLNLKSYRLHYFADFPVLGKNRSEFQIAEHDTGKIIIPNFIASHTPDIFRTLYNLLCESDTSYPYPYLPNVNPMSKNLVQVFALLTECKKDYLLELDNFFKVVSQTHQAERPFAPKSKKELMEDVMMHCYKTGIDKNELDNLPAGINYIFNSILYFCRENPPTNWPSSVYELIDRQDLAALEQKVAGKDYLENEENKYIQRDRNHDDKDLNDGMELDYTILRLRFNVDYRVREVRQCLDSSEPIPITITQRPEVSDHEFIEEQERYLHSLCTRTMALPIGRGIFTMRSSMPVNTEQLPIPRLCLTGKAPPRGTTVELTHIDVPSNMNTWPLFHNGLATGLCIHPSAKNVDSTWIVYNKQQQGEFGIEHSGFLMALGLNGHLKNLAPFSMYEYLVECHETTSVGLLLGLSATHRSSMDVSMTKLLSLHVETLLPPTSIELNVQQNVQVAALMGVGLVYQGTNHRHISHALLAEIGRPPGPEMKNCVDRESYSLTAGMALGLVVLGSGGGCDLASIPDTLHYYMVGGNTRPFVGAQRDKYKSPSYQIREGDSINIDVTSPGATIALGFMYMKTGNHAVAEWMAAPNTQYLLDFVRPDLLMLRILAKSLILWDDIEPSRTWASSHVPEIVAKYKMMKPSAEITEFVDLETINQAYCNIIAGACMAMGLKYAGTENQHAFNTLFHFLKSFMNLTTKSVAELAGKATIETCTCVVLLAVSIVMAGTGNLEILRVCRYLRTRVGPSNSVVTYGSQMAYHMALGFLFLGGGCYNLRNDPASVAALVIALFPKFPTHSNDNRYHLQALRHFYVLATEPRLLLPKDIDSEAYCFAQMKLTFAGDGSQKGPEVIVKAPCMLPQLDSLLKVELDDDRYWKITFDRDRNFDQLKKILNANCSLYVKQKAGCLSHMEDPQGFRTLLAQTLTTDDVIIWTASPKQITSFTSNSIILNFVNSFLKKVDQPCDEECDDYCVEPVHHSLTELCFGAPKNGNRDIKEIRVQMSDMEHNFLQQLTNIAYECVVRDKVSFMPLWLSIQKLLVTLEKQPKGTSVWQIKFLTPRKLHQDFPATFEKLLNMENIIANNQRLNFIMDSWEGELSTILHQFSESNSIIARTLDFDRFHSYMLNYNIPKNLNDLILEDDEENIFTEAMSCRNKTGMCTLYNLFNGENF